MSSSRKRKLRMLDGEETDDYSGGIQSEISKFGQHSTSGRQHTIDSDDEEEDDDDYNKRKHSVLDDEEIEGQEDDTVQFDGETKITPFNMKDELEEGYFDGSGMYIWNKRDASEVKDSWLDSIDWMKVKPPTKKKKKSDSDKDGGDDKEEATASSRTGKEEEKGEDDDDDDDEDETAAAPVDVLELYKQMLSYLKPGENVLKAIKRLGSSSAGPARTLSASERLKQKKKAAKNGESTSTAPSTSSTGDDASNGKKQVTKTPPPADDFVTKLTELADTILSATGNMDIYQETYEGIQIKIKRESEKKLAVNVSEDDDMFGDSFEAKKDEQAANVGSSGGGDSSSSINDASDEVQWEFKWEDKEEAPVYGPHTSTEMHSWVNEGYFKDGVFVRKYKKDGPFYTSKRIDFELYC